LYRVAVRADGGAVREDDAEAEPLDDDDALLGDGEVVAMAVKELSPLVWRTFAEGRVALSEGGAVVTHIAEAVSLTTTGLELTEGKRYWEAELLSEIGGELVDINCYLSRSLMLILIVLYGYVIFIGVRHRDRDQQTQP
jgi:hypothetical protein